MQRYDLYLREQAANSSFWTNHSAMFHNDRIKIPVYLVAGLFDAYKDFGFNVFSGIRAAGGTQPLKLVIVPTQHEVKRKMLFALWLKDFLVSLGEFQFPFV